ncbi:hypothetical protein [Mesorhizobium sp. YM1C-6-2]|uniref:hypothetical protein n=1 Tax=Mesorhizobium sp. YM1C-6-2 TaxID=1827501 RepID=UPI000EF21097|nr:hypothetical protein [Mesorhizobium sp. YM1C-6-2]RLP23900.1 hypothetical protein D8676_17835 [Mesorhizobium sp. YM1C-6-2]
MALIVTCFIVGLIFVMLFSSEGRWFLKSLLNLVAEVAEITFLGALLLGGGVAGVVWLLWFVG